MKVILQEAGKSELLLLCRKPPLLIRNISLCGYLSQLINNVKQKLLSLEILLQHYLRPTFGSDETMVSAQGTDKNLLLSSTFYKTGMLMVRPPYLFTQCLAHRDTQ